MYPAYTICFNVKLIVERDWHNYSSFNVWCYGCISWVSKWSRNIIFPEIINSYWHLKGLQFSNFCWKGKFTFHFLTLIAIYSCFSSQICSKTLFLFFLFSFFGCPWQHVQNQFFISGLSRDEIIRNRVLEALYRRIMRAYNDQKTFRVIIVIPLLPGFQVLFFPLNTERIYTCVCLLCLNGLFTSMLCRGAWMIAVQPLWEP